MVGIIFVLKYFEKLKLTFTLIKKTSYHARRHHAQIFYLVAKNIHLSLPSTQYTQIIAIIFLILITA
jgi:hypothetical protein